MSLSPASLDLWHSRACFLFDERKGQKGQRGSSRGERMKRTHQKKISGTRQSMFWKEQEKRDVRSERRASKKRKERTLIPSIGIQLLHSSGSSEEGVSQRVRPSNVSEEGEQGRTHGTSPA